MTATQYDLLATPFTNKVEMLSYEYSSSGLPSESIIHMIECDPAQTPVNTLDIRSPSATSGDPRFADLGVFTIATQGFQGTNVNIGELWVTYQCTLIKPKLYSSLGKYNDYFRLVSTGSEMDVILSGYPLGVLGTTANLEMANCTIYPLANGSFVDSLGHSYGNIEKPGFYIQQRDNSEVRIYWPVYAYTASFLILYSCEFNTSVTVIDWALTNGGSYGAASTPSTLFAFKAGTATHGYRTWNAGIRVPGQKLLPYDPSLDRPYTEFNLSVGNLHVDSFQFTIVQINSDQPQSLIE